LASSAILGASGQAAEYLQRLQEKVDRLAHVSIVPQEPEQRATARARIRGMHRGLGFPPGRPFVAALHQRGVTNRNLLNHAWGQAEGSRGVARMERPAPRLRASLPRVTTWNELVAWDAFVVPRYLLTAPQYARQHSRTVLHGLCAFTRFHEGAHLDQSANEHSAPGYCAVMGRLWYRRWGPPATAKVDLGSAFDSEEFLQSAREWGFTVEAAPKGAHWCHGLAERGGQTLNILVCRVLEEEPTANLSLVVEECVFVKNCSILVDGLTPYQRLIGVNPRLPDLENATLGQLCLPAEGERLQIRELARKHIALMDVDHCLKRGMACNVRWRPKQYAMGAPVCVLLSGRVGGGGPWLVGRRENHRPG
jgi:hypothetical protein